MSTAKLLLACSCVALLYSNTAIANTDSIQCDFSPHLICSTHNKILWRNTHFDTPETIVEDGQHIYLSHNNTAYSFDASTGKPGWEIKTQNNARYFYPVVSKNYIYLTRTDSVLEKRDVDTGKLVWSRSVGKGWIYPPVATDKQLITAGQDRTIWILDAETGDIQDNIALDQELVAPLHRIGHQFIASTFDGKVSAYSHGKQKPDWQTNITTPAFAHFSNADELIVADMGGNLSAIDTKTGALRWQQKVHDSAQYWPVLQKQTLYSLTDSGTLNILDANSGQLQDSIKFAHRFAQAPIVQDDSIVLFDTEGSALLVKLDETTGTKLQPQ